MNSFNFENFNNKKILGNQNPSPKKYCAGVWSYHPLKKSKDQVGKRWNRKFKKYINLKNIFQELLIFILIPRITFCISTPISVRIKLFVWNYHSVTSLLCRLLRMTIDPSMNCTSATVILFFAFSLCTMVEKMLKNLSLCELYKTMWLYNCFMLC